MDWSDGRDFEFARRGFIAKRVEPKVLDVHGNVVTDRDVGAFLDDPKLATVHPSLLRQARLLRISGLFEVVEGVYQVRGLGSTNVTFIRGKTGWIVIDPALATEVARAALDLVTEHLGNRPIKAVIYTHSHLDHFGGVAGVTSQQDVDSGKVQIVAPAGFMAAFGTEFLMNGPIMYRRGSFNGMGRKRGPMDLVNAGLGDEAEKGTTSLIPPTREIAKSGEKLVIDGIELEFQLTPSTEAPSEMNIYLPQFRVLDMAENANITLHNVLSPRGVVVRDAKSWADELSASIHLFGGRSDVVILSHGWPRFGQSELIDYLSKHRDAYKFLHDQTVRMLNDGLLPDEIANRLHLPDSLAKEWFNRGYYGNFSFNARAIYQRYIGWYQGNPVELQPLEPADKARRYVAAMGGRDHTFALARKAEDENDDRWASELLNRLVMANADDQQARDKLADVYSRMGLEQENAIWRAHYIVAASELRNGVTHDVAAGGAQKLMRVLSTPDLFEMLAVRLDPAKVRDAASVIDFVIPERSERIRVHVRNQVLTFDTWIDPAAADATVTLNRMQLAAMLFGQTVPEGVQIRGSRDTVIAFTRWFTNPSVDFPILWRSPEG